MGAAKNARKARRKAHRCADRRPYLLDSKAYSYLNGPGASFPYSRNSFVIVTEWDPRKQKDVEIGRKVHLTVKEAAELRALSQGTVAAYDPKPTPPPLHQGVYKGLLDHINDPFVASMFDTSWLKQFPITRHTKMTPREWQVPSFNADGSIKRDPTKGTVTSNKTLAHIDDVDYSSLEKRVVEFMGQQIDKKAFYAALYGATEDRVRDLYLDHAAYSTITMNDFKEWNRERERTRRRASVLDDLYQQKPLPTPLIPDPLDRTYRGQKIGDIVRSHPLNQKVTKDDQDLPEVGSVPAHRS